MILQIDLTAFLLHFSGGYVNEMLIHKQGIFLDEKVYDLVKDISEDYSRRGG